MFRSLLIFPLFLASCSLLLPFDIDGLPCDDDDHCQQGYFCNADTLCEKIPPEVACRPKCGPLESCDQGTCKPSCDGRSCAAGKICDEESGSCVDHPYEGTLGGACFSQNDCSQGGASAFCLRPWGQAGQAEVPGTCTRTCDPGKEDDECGEGLSCVTFPGSGKDYSLCVVPSLSPCESEGDCVASGLSCGIHSVLIKRSTPQQWASASACRARLDSGELGSSSCQSPAECSSGLCLQREGRALCSTPCEDATQCEEVDAIVSPSCTDMLLSGGSNPTLRAKLCMPGKSKLLQSCKTDTECSFDAPFCLPLPEYGGTDKHCTTPCDLSTCPKNSHCRKTTFSEVEWQEYCGAPNTGPQDL